MNTKFHGVVVPLLTPFRQDESLDEEGLRKLCRRLMEHGVHGLFPAGSTGEAYALERDERLRVIEIVISEAQGKVPVFAGAGGISTREAVYFARKAEEAGADALVVLTPYYITPSEQELYDHYATVASATRLPLLPYNNPARTAVNLSPSLVRRLSQISNVVGIKESSGNLSLTAEYLNLTPKDFAIFQGRDDLILWSLQMGATGAVAAVANIAPSLVMAVYHAFEARDWEQAVLAQKAVSLLRSALSLGTFPAVFKEAMALVGFPVGCTRLPVGPLSEAAREKLRAILNQIGGLIGDRPSLAASRGGTGQA